MKKESSTNLQKYSGIAEQMIKCYQIVRKQLKIYWILYMETKEKETELVQLVRQLRDYVILDRKDYEKLVQNSSPEKFNESALEARDAHIKLLEQDKSTTLDRIGDIIGNGCTTDIESDKAEHNMPETEKYFYRLTKSNN